jgi:hypothetical protein
VLTLNAGDAYLQPDISALLTTSFQGSLAIIVSDTPAPSNNQIVVTGSASIALFSAASSSLPVSATFSIAASGTPQVLLAVTPSTPWTLATSFPTFANTLLGDLSFTQASVGFASAGLPNAGSGLQGTLDMQQQPLASVAWLLNVTTTLPVSGTITPTSAAPELDLKSVSSGQIEVGHVNLDVYLHLAASYQPNANTPSRQLLAVVELASDYLLGPAKHPLTFRAELYYGVMSVLEFRAEVGGLLLEGFSDLADFASGQPIDDALPQDLPPLSGHTILNAITIIANAATKRIESVALEVGLVKDTQQPPPSALGTIATALNQQAAHVDVSILYGSEDEVFGAFGDDAEDEVPEPDTLLAQGSTSDVTIVVDKVEP